HGQRGDAVKDDQRPEDVAPFGGAAARERHAQRRAQDRADRQDHVPRVIDLPHAAPGEPVDLAVAATDVERLGVGALDEGLVVRPVGAGDGRRVGAAEAGQHAHEGPLAIDDLGLRPDGRGGYAGRRPGYRFDIERDGTLHFRDPPPVDGLAVVGLGLAAVFDLTDLVMRARGMDPYSYDKG